MRVARVSLERSFIDSPRLNSFRGSRRGGRIVIREGMKRCEQQCPSRLYPSLLHPPPPLLPSPTARPRASRYSASCNQPRARRIGPQPNDRTANIWQLRNMSLHLIIAVNTGGRVEWPQGVSTTRYGRGRARPPAWGKFRFTSPPLPPSHLFLPYASDDIHYYYSRRRRTPYWRGPSVFSFALLYFSHTRLTINLIFFIVECFILYKGKIYTNTWCPQ